MSFRDGPSGPGAEPKNTGQAIDLSGQGSWIPGSRAEPAPRNDDVPAFFRSLLAPGNGGGLMSWKMGPMMRLVIAAAISLRQGQPANALLLWNWSYSGAGVSASGTFTTNDAPDGAGFYQIVGISGTDNGATIASQPTGTAIPSNEPYAVDNLVSAAGPRLTTHGFGFSLANGNYANPFYNGSSYFEYLSVPSYVNGAGPEKSVSPLFRSRAQPRSYLRVSPASSASAESLRGGRT